MMPLLSGKLIFFMLLIFHIPLFSTSFFVRYYVEWPFEFKVGKGPYDDVQFIWPDFKRQNYTTGYIEDHPEFALFNYLVKGFKNPPTDYVHFATNKPKITYWLKQIKKFLNKVNKTKQSFFLWSFYIQVTHEDFNNAQLIDQYIADFINSYRHILENTVFVIMGDHNNRYGPLFMTGYGQIETRMPLFNIHVPPQLIKKEMLKDIVSGNHTYSCNYEPIVYPSKRAAYSVWREEVPLDRTCKDALIPVEYCLCLKRHNFPVDSQLAQIVSTALVARLNQALSEFNDLCHELFLKDIYNAEVARLPGELNPNNRVEVTISANPPNGTFQALLYLKDTTNLNNSGIDNWMLEGDVSRLDFYGNQSLCINDRVASMHRTCKDALIPVEYFLCLKRHNLPVDSQLAQTASNVLITKLNQALSDYNNHCHELSLKIIHRSEVSKTHILVRGLT
uniref:Uncharacterized protein n=1 Tax=Tetranychus urticae TaxID=32264 RepID=T1KBP6_TETUR